MIYQVFEITKTFIVDNQVIEIVFGTDLKFPKISIVFEVLMDEKIIKNEYKNFWNEIKFMDNYHKKYEIRETIPDNDIRKF